LNSKILNSGNDIPNVYSITWDEVYIKALLDKYKGVNDGKYLASNDKFMSAKIPAVLADLEAVEAEFERYQQSKVNQGFHKPKTMPTNLQKKKFTLEAEYDVVCEEAEEMEKFIDKIGKNKQKSRNEHVLRHGLEQISTGDPVREIDGQPVTQIESILVIDCPESPYDGMAVADYRILASKWRSELRKRQREVRKKREQEIKEKGYSSIKRNARVPRPKYPDWPDGVKNYKKAKAK
jgi:hypothetical protein